MRVPGLLLLSIPLAAASDFEATIAPLLRAKCASCHSAKTRSGGLSVESRDDILRGGKSGPAIVPGRPVDSLVLTLAATGKMPMSGPKLAGAEIEAIRKWIEREDGRPPVAERDVHAVLAAKCWVCHGRTKKEAGLDLRTRESLLRGGKSGPAISAGDADGSLLVKRIAKQEMPPPKLQEQFSVRGLTDDELAKVRRWISDGAAAGVEQAVEVDPRNDPAVRAKDREFWAFQTPRAAAGGIDAIAKEKAPIAPEAAPLALLRRAAFDLTGLPPSPEEVAAFERDRDPRRFEKLIGRLLESPHYGERQAQHWLDAVGYADSEGGNNSDALRPQAWRYRDSAIRAFQRNMPFDKFLIEQIAGDETFDFRAAKHLTPEHMDTLAATGFWRMAPDGTNSTEQNFIPERMDVIAGQLEVFGSAVMGLSIDCARCHDHKYDPIPTRDYYGLVSILTPSFDPYAWLPGTFPCGGVGADCDENNTRFLIAKASPEFAAAKAHNEPVEARIRELNAQIEERAKPYRERYAREKKVEKAKAAALAAEYETFKKEKADLDEQIRKEREKKKPVPLVRALFELGPEPPPTRILLRGDAASPGALVSPGVPSAAAASIAPFRVEPLAHSSGRRLALARWLTQPDHPLTARVMVNRIWQQHFGTGIVATSGNFGRMGSQPANQKLLDWLAVEFVRSGWDVKHMHRLIMASAVYRQRAGDGGFPLRRIDAESMRDAILKIAGRLDGKQFGEPAAVKVMPDGEVIAPSLRRSIYVTQRRTQPVSFLDTFDKPFLNPNCVRRNESVVSSQALHLMNSSLARENSRYMAGRVIDEAGEDAGAQVDRAYLLALGRRATEAERGAGREAVERMAPEWEKKLKDERPAEPVKPRARWLALAALCHTLMNTAEFQYVD